MTLEEQAIQLLLRSPRLEVSTIIDLMDVSDAEFREMARRNTRIAELMTARAAGTLASREVEPTRCPSCDDWFVPYAAARFCSDACRTVALINGAKRRD